VEFDILLRRTYGRVVEFSQSAQANVILADAALVEAAELWTATQPADAGHLTLEEDRQIRAARRVIGTLHFLRYAASAPQDIAELARAIVFLAPLADDPVSIPPELHQVLGSQADVAVQATLGTVLVSHASTGADPVLLEAAVLLFGFAVAATPDDHPYRGPTLYNLGEASLQRFYRTGAPGELDRAVDAGEQAIATVRDDDPNLAMYLNNLGLIYRERHQHAGAREDLERAVNAGEQAVAAADGDDPHQAMYLTNLGLAYHERFEVEGTVADLQRAVEIGEQAVAAASQADPNRGAYLSNASIAYRQRFLTNGTLDDLERAVDLAERAVAATPHDNPKRSAHLSNLGVTYRERYKRLGMPADLERVIEVGEQAVAATPEAHPDRSAPLANLGLAYHERYARTGTVADLDRAIDLAEKSIAETSSDHLYRVGLMTNLGSGYAERYKRLGRLADLRRAIEVGEQAVAAAPVGGPDAAVHLTALGVAYRRRWERVGTPADLRRAIDLLGQAIERTPDDHPGRAGYLSALGFAYVRRFEHGHEPADIERGIDLIGRAVAAIPEDHPNRAGLLSDLAHAYKTRFRRGQEAADLESAIDLINQAMAATPEDHPTWTQYLINLAQTHHARFEADGGRVEKSILAALAQQAAHATTAEPRAQVSARWAVGSLAHVMNDNRTAAALLDAAVARLPSVAPREGGWADQEHHLGEHLGLVGDAVAAHCAIDDPAGAIEVAEAGRGILFANHLDSRTELTALDRAHPELASRLRQIRDRLATPGSGPVESPVDAVTTVETRKRMWADHDAVLAEIRGQTDFTRFLLPPRFAELRPAAADGAVVLVNAGRSRSDAIIITADADPVQVTLPELTLIDVMDHAVLLHDNDRGQLSLARVLRRRRSLTESLSWLWTSTVEPILDALPARVDDNEPLPRVWWLPIGLLGLFPLHSAGRPGEPGALDAVVSSYVPTLRALAHSRNQPAATYRRQLTVALEHTPGLPNLPGTVVEAAELHGRHPGAPALTDQDATTDNVLAALPDVTWAHFACHASTDLTAPSEGGLRLHDGTLPIADISRLRLTNAELAYLSACSTAHRGLRHVEESIHLASAFQLAGFRHVIASLWPLDDQVAATAARAFYGRLADTPSADHAATVLHEVTHDLRTSHPDCPDLWAPLIHNGP
jgi:tetratricopeptide (TPR) repeat protein